MTWFKKSRGPRVDPEEIIEKAQASITKVQDQQPRVNFINSWLDGRYKQNGLGDDFEWTLKPKGTS